MAPNELSDLINEIGKQAIERLNATNTPLYPDYFAQAFTEIAQTKSGTAAETLMPGPGPGDSRRERGSGQRVHRPLRPDHPAV